LWARSPFGGPVELAGRCISRQTGEIILLEEGRLSLCQLNKNTGNRIRYSKVDAEAGEEVDSEDIIKGYQVSKGHYIEITDEDLEAVAVESTTSTSSSRVRKSTTSTTSGPTHRPGG